MTFSRLLASRSIVAAGTLLAFVPLTATMVRADVKIVSETKITGLPDALKSGDTVGVDTSKPIPSTLYLKGEKRRTETPVQVMIYDCVADAVYTLNTTDKTYTVTTFAKSVEADTSNSNPLLSLLKIETSAVTLTPQKTTKDIAGKLSTSYTFGMTLKMSPADPSLSEMIPNLITTVKGEQWFSESIASPAVCAKMAKSTFINSLPIPKALAGTGLKSLSEKIATIKGTPLSSRIEVTVKPGDGKAADANVLPIPKEPIIVVNEVKSISEEALDDSLFTVPADYKKVNPDAKSVTPPAAPPATDTAPPAAPK
jgi:hypothetical protein